MVDESSEKNILQFSTSGSPETYLLSKHGMVQVDHGTFPSSGQLNRWLDGRSC